MRDKGLAILGHVKCKFFDLAYIWDLGLHSGGPDGENMQT